MGIKRRQSMKGSHRRDSRRADENSGQARRIDVLLKMAEEERLGLQRPIHDHFYRPTSDPTWHQCECGKYRQVALDE